MRQATEASRKASGRIPRKQGSFTPNPTKSLDTVLDLAAGATKSKLVAVMKGHILAQGQRMGRYGR